MTICDLHRRKIFLTARSCVGRPFRHQGRHPVQGLDCVGLIIYVSKALELNSFDRLDYKKIPGRLAISRYAKAAGFTACAIADMRPGDVVLLRFGRYMEHSAIVSDRGLIHACEKYGRVVEHAWDVEWRSKIISVHSFPDFLPDSLIDTEGQV